MVLRSFPVECSEELLVLIEGLDDTNKAFLDVIASNYVPEVIVPYLVKLFEVEEVALMMQVFLNDESAVEDVSSYYYLPWSLLAPPTVVPKPSFSIGSLWRLIRLIVM